MITYAASIQVGADGDRPTDHTLPGTFAETWTAWRALAEMVDPAGDACAQRIRDALITFAEEGVPNTTVEFPESSIRFTVSQYIEIGA